MRRSSALALARLVAGCGGGAPDVASAQMALTTSGLSPSDVGAVEVLVLEGTDAGCAHLAMLASPLDDGSLTLVAHALFTVDGLPKHLSIPAGRKLTFWAEAYRSPSDRTVVGRGCLEQTLAAGESSGVTLTITAVE